MTDKKLTDKDIIKALPNMTYGGHYCAKCKYDNGQGDDRCGLKGCKIARYALDLITRQQAEIENLKVENQSLRGAANSFKIHYEEAQAEIERLNKEIQITKDAYTMLQTKIEIIKSEAVKEFAQKVIEKVEKARQKYQRLCAEQGDKEDEAMNIHFSGMINIVKEMVGEDK